ncbi:MAG: hypothetical protein NXH85_06745 [Pseudomonadaceae bacterium]|nr:hypothetical protein [Pseudomonadaceae bacterium]
MHCLLLLEPPSATQPDNDDNARLIPRAFKEAGWTVIVQPQASLREHNGRVFAGEHELAGDKLVWHLGLGARASFLDRMQMLSVLPDRQYVTSPRALLALHGKFHWQSFGPTTFVSGDPDWLLAQRDANRDWIAKPSAGSFGRGVTPLTGNDREDLVTLRRITDTGAMAVLQEVIVGAADGEVRTLVAAGRRIGSYRRCGDQLNNLAAGGIASTAQLSAPQREIVQQIARELSNERVGFAAIDLIGETLLEVNIANPGGLATLVGLGDREAGTRLARAFEQW